MAEVLVNGREPLDWELPALERGRKCELERGCDLLQGVLASDRQPPPPGRPVIDLPGLP